jgi:MFS family permease
MLSLTYNKNLFMIVSLTFTSLLGFPIISPALPAVRDALGISTENIGWIMAAYSLPGIFFMPLSGLLADRYGKRRILFPSVFLFALAGGACAFAPNFETLIFLRLLQGIGASALSTLNVAMVGDYFKGQDRVRVMGTIAATQNIGSGVLPLAGGALATIAWFYPFGSSLLAVPLVIYLIFAMEEVRSESISEKSGTRAFLSHAWSKLNNRIVLELVFMTGGFIFIGFGAFITYIPFVLKDNFGSPEILIGLIIAARSTMGVIMATQLVRLTQHFSYRTLVFCAFLTMSAGMAIVPFAQSQWTLILTAMCYGGSFGIIRPSLQVLLLNHAPDDLRSTFASASNFGLRVAQTISPVGAGFILITGTYSTLYIVAAVLAGLMALFALTAVSLRPID